jgi:hypothetical protein
VSIFQALIISPSYTQSLSILMSCHSLGNIMSSKGSSKISIIQFLDNYANKDEVHEISRSFDLVTSGTKKELLEGLAPFISTKKPEEILEYLSKDSLKDACRFYSLPLSSLKTDLIDRIIHNVLSMSSKEKIIKK